MLSGEDIMKDFSTPLVGTDIPLAMKTLAEAECVCFDVDSTVINEEGIVSAKRLLGPEIQRIFVNYTSHITLYIFTHD